MALTHHVIVHLAGKISNVSPTGKYVLLGDDIIIADSKIAQAYKELMSELCVPISEEKTLVSNETFEFAKRIGHKGTEVTPFPLPAILTTWKRYFLLQNSLETARTRGYRIDHDKEQIAILNILSRLGKPGQAQRVLKLFNVFDNMIRKDLSQEVRIGQVYKYICATWQPIKGSRLVVTEENLKNFYRDLISQHIQEQLRSTLYDNTALVFKLEGYEIYEMKAMYRGHSSLSNVSFDLLKPLHPLFHYVGNIRELVNPIMDKLDSTDEADDQLTILKECELEFPRLSIKCLTPETSRVYCLHKQGL